MGADHGVAFRPARAGGGDASCARSGKPDAVLAVDDPGLELAALLRDDWACRAIPCARCAARATSWRFAGCCGSTDSCCPAFHHLPTGETRRWLTRLTFPVVVKARRLSGSRGVIRADNAAAFVAAVQRVRAIQSRADRDAQRTGADGRRLHSGARVRAGGHAGRGELACSRYSTSPIRWTDPTSKRRFTSHPRVARGACRTHRQRGGARLPRGRTRDGADPRRDAGQRPRRLDLRGRGALHRRLVRTRAAAFAGDEPGGVDPAPGLGEPLPESPATTAPRA